MTPSFSSPDRFAANGEPDGFVDPAVVRAALDSMPEQLRVTLVEIYLGGRSVGEVADLLAVSEDTVRAHAGESLRMMREALRRRSVEARNRNRTR
ncbi:sigma factor-like helix-turn-helix DNA-binding protein [Actinoplanes sp. NBRC 103695]|uniref:RNA polymerase sigma factor n=1 Tax=Actinoplanes sp. NBRC 103695 TaxID=3032202 RepID=UPI002556380E|nr:sigma factor-like helix-turn-helix DNA-binding protein [Actinoplanes sp. NBRC 103695]